ncbi:flagellar hook-length control protein FliK [Vibrio alfacsensis]|uniref:flagellar hook-length control protein FliK n=1 Tax=Vibrio alfacsensis TaxID=1074311 RepID=UPI0040698767
MNVNLSNVSATNKTSSIESSSKAGAENTESKGFLETLAGVFTSSQKAEKAEKSVAEPVVTEVTEESSEESAKVQSGDLEGENQKTATAEVQRGNVSTDELLAHGDAKSNPKGELTEASPDVASISSDVEHSADHSSEKGVISAKTSDVESAMDEGQQLLGRIQQANQTLNANDTMQGGNVLPLQGGANANGTEQVQSEVLVEQTDVDPQHSLPGSPSVENADALEASLLEEQMSNLGSKVTPQIDWHSASAQTTHAEATMNATTQAAINGQVVAQDAGAMLNVEADVNAGDIKHIALNELEIIDTKLAQGQPLSQQELAVIDGLRSGSVVADIPEQDLVQFVALPSDVKRALSEQQDTQQNTARQSASVSMAQQAQNTTNSEMKPTVSQVTQSPDKTGSSMPEALLNVNTHPAGQVAASVELSNKVMNAGLAAGALKAAAEKQDKLEPQHGLAGQIQAAVNQQSANATQQARVDAAQQAQLPLQLTKELANEQMAEKVQMMMSKNLKNLDIRLDPPELGRMQIRMTMNNDLANVHFTVTNPQAREIIEQTMPRLREMLAQQGMQLADSSVQQQSSGQQQGQHTTSDQHGQGTLGKEFAQQTDENFDGDINLDLNVASKRDGISFYA